MKHQTENNQWANNLVSAVIRHLSIDYIGILYILRRINVILICISLKYKNIKYSS